MPSPARHLEQLRSGVEELLEHRARRRTGRDFSRYRHDPVGFIQDVLGETDPGLWDGLERICRTVESAPLTVVQSCNSAGKDWTAARLALWWTYAVGGLALITGPTERQVREIVMGEVRRAFAKADSLWGELYAMSLRVGDDEARGILAFTSREASRLTGFHAPRVLAIITEAQAVEPWVFEGMLACAAGDEDRILAVGNPLSPSGSFYNASRSDAWETIELSAADHPNVKEGRTVIAGAVTRQFVARIEGEYGKGSNTYKARVLGQFPDTGEEALFRRSWLDAAAERWADEGWRRSALEEADTRPIVAVDPARYGPDATAVAVRRGPVLERIEVWHSLDTQQTAERVFRLARDEGIEPLAWREVKEGPRTGLVVVDEIGIGSGVLDFLKHKDMPTRGFNGAKRHPGRFLNDRASSHWRLRDRLEAGEVALPDDDRLFDELLATNWKPAGDGSIQIEAKQEIRARLGRSPDRADAVVMAYMWDVAAHEMKYVNFNVL